MEALYTQGERNAENLRHEMAKIIQAEPLAQPDYISVADLDSLEELQVLEGRALVSLAVRFGTTRLIDNTVLPEGSDLF